MNFWGATVTPKSKQARGYAVQICILLKNAPDLELGESKEFPPLKILTAKTVGTYISKNKNIFVDVDEPTVEQSAEKKKAVSKKRPATTVEAPIVKRKRKTGRAAPEAKSLALVIVAQEAIPIQMVSVCDPSCSKTQSTKEEVEAAKQMETDMEEPSLTRSDDIIVEITKRSIAVNDEDDNLDGAENEIARKMASFIAPKQFLKEPLRSGEDDDISGSKQPNKSKYDEESMSIEDILKQIPEGIMLPSLTAVEPTRIKFGLGIEIPGFNEGDWYKASLGLLHQTRGRRLLLRRMKKRASCPGDVHAEGGMRLRSVVELEDFAIFVQLIGLRSSADRFIKTNQQMLLSRSADIVLSLQRVFAKKCKRQRFDKLERRRRGHCFISADEDFSRLFVEEVQQLV
ncbi:splicing factor 3B subunit 1-like [Dorcoceras hygrometricum]|uniref:Splicing factor 3B subunit 1-like n=1 Tax=Dorcoceras hygrometricum TaxID=472368 RepID=A0A2Z7CN41_9LAMI|nr:splicing factor 3B subunit 1-like [Dorcoceras hygrometricum]